MKLKIEEMSINKQSGDIGFLIKIINNLLEKYDNMEVKDDSSSYTTVFKLSEGLISATIKYNKSKEELEIEICNDKNFQFETDLKQELKELSIFKE